MPKAARINTTSRRAMLGGAGAALAAAVVAVPVPPAAHVVRDAQEAAFLAGIRSLNPLERVAFREVMEAMVAHSPDYPATARRFLELRGWSPAEIAAEFDGMLAAGVGGREQA
jgi:hypothetical protein